MRRKRTTLPARYEAGFLKGMDRRTEVYQKLREAYETIVNDAGGLENLSHTRLALIERFVFLEACLQTWENKIATEPKESAALVSRWIQAVNSLQGLAKVIGLQQSRAVRSLKAYVEERA